MKLVILVIGLAMLIGGSVWRVRASDVFFNQPQFAYVVREVSASAGHHIIEQAIVSRYADHSLALLENNIKVDKKDKVSRYPEAVPAVGGVIVVEQAPVIHLTDGKKTRDIRSWSTILEDALSENNVSEIGVDDKITPSVNGEVAHDMNVVIVRVRKTNVIEKEKIPFKTIEQEDPNIERGKNTVKVAGRDGVKERTFEVTREDGVEVSKVLKKTEVTVSKEDRVISKGTKLIIGKVMSGTASWYKSSYSAASNVLKRGTNVRVTNLKTGKSLEIRIEDHMAGKTHIIDLRPDIFQQLGGTLGQGIQSVKVEEVLN